jgi:hypothetical protein
MSLSVVKDVVEYNPVRNPARYGVQSSVFNPGTPVAPYLAIYFNDADRPANGDTITLTSIALGGSIEFTFLTTPGAEPDELPAYTAGTTADYVIALAAALQAKYLVNAFYQVVPVNVGPVYGILILGRNQSLTPGVTEYSTDQDLTWSRTGWVEDSDTTVNANSFELPANAGIIFQVHADFNYPNADVRIMLEEAYPPDGNGRAYVDAAETVRSLLRPQWPAVNASASYTALTAMTKYFIRSAERYGDPPIAYPMLSSTQVFAYLGGRNETNRALFPSYEDQVIGVSTNIKFLSNWPNTDVSRPKLVTPDQNEYLSWIFPSDRGTTFLLRADLYWETGSPTTLHTIDTFNSRFNELLVCPIGVLARNLSAVDPTRRLRAFRVYLTTSGTAVRSQYRYYQVDHRYHHWTTQMLWWSNTGALDTIMLHGQSSAEAAIAVQSSGATVIDPTSSVLANDTVTTSMNVGQVTEQGTQYLLEDELIMLKDLASSEYIRIIDSANAWAPVQLLDMDDVSLRSDGNGRTSRRIAYRVAHTNKSA